MSDFGDSIRNLNEIKRLEKIAGAPSRYVSSKENEATATTKIMTITTKTERQSIKNNIIKTVN